MRDLDRLRVSEKDREFVIAQLRRSVGTGMLNIDEFTERTDAALAARNRGELNAVLYDLPDTVPAPKPTPAPVVGHVNQLMGATKRSGRWSVPDHLVIRKMAGSVLLNFTRADIARDTVVIELEVRNGSTRIVLPQGSSIDVQRLNMAAGRLRMPTRVPQARGTPHFVLVGTVWTGSVKIKQPMSLRQRWARLIGDYPIEFPEQDDLGS